MHHDVSDAKAVLTSQTSVSHVCSIATRAVTTMPPLLQGNEPSAPAPLHKEQEQHAGLACALHAVESLSAVQLETLAGTAGRERHPLIAALALRQMAALAEPLPHTLWRTPAAGAPPKALVLSDPGATCVLLSSRCLGCSLITGAQSSSDCVNKSSCVSSIHSEIH